MQEVKDGKSVLKVSQSSGIPKSSLYEFIKLHKFKKNKFLRTVGRKPTLNRKEELNIVKACITAADLGWPTDRKDVAEIFSRYCIRMKRKTQFKNNFQGKTYMMEFFKKHKDQMTFRTASTLKVSRAVSEHPTVISDFIDLVDRGYKI